MKRHLPRFMGLQCLQICLTVALYFMAGAQSSTGKVLVHSREGASLQNLANSAQPFSLFSAPWVFFPIIHSLLHGAPVRIP